MPLSSHFLFLLLLIGLWQTSASESNCKCTVDSPCWPEEGAWDGFNGSVSGRLLTLHQPFHPCHDPHYDEDACRRVHQMYGNIQWLTDQSSALVTQVWLEKPYTPWNQTCSFNMNRKNPCLLGNVPSFAVDARTIEDIQKTVKFASQHNIRLVIRNTGHDFLGRSTAAGALSLWTHHMDNVTVHNAFVPEQCDNGTPEHAVTVQAGVQWQQVYHELGDYRAVVGGALGTVGAAGGYVAGGGHSPLSPKFGMAADTVLQFTLVTANGEAIVANKCKNVDLFWALRGGGGSTFGVIYNVTYQTFPQEPSVFAFMYISAEGPALEAISRRWDAIQLELAEEGFSGYFMVLPSAFTFQYFLFGSPDITHANKTLSKFVDFAQQQAERKSIYSIRQHASFRHLQKSLTLCESTTSSHCPPFPLFHGGTYMTSRLAPKTLFEKENIQAFSDVLWNVTETLIYELNGIMVGHLVAGGRVAEIEPDSVAVNPAWRKALVHYVLSTDWAPNTPVDLQRQIREKTTAITRQLIDITPTSGAYLNEASPEEPNWQQSFFGNHYERLLSIKQKWDPKSLFVCRECVGSEIFEDENLTCLKSFSDP